MKVQTHCPKCSKALRIPKDKVITFSCASCHSKLYAIGGDIIYRLLDKLFDKSFGWDYSLAEMPVELKFTKDYIPYYEISIDKIKVNVFQQDEFGSSFICSSIILEGLHVHDIENMLFVNMDNIGTYSWGCDQNKTTTLQTSFPIFDGIPVEVARKQLKIGISKIAKEALSCYERAKTKGFDWETAGNVATIVGKLLRGIMG